MNRWSLTMGGLLAAIAVGTGCAEGITMIGNGLSMVVACVLLWSTINLNRPERDEEPYDEME